MAVQAFNIRVLQIMISARKRLIIAAITERHCINPKQLALNQFASALLSRTHWVVSFKSKQKFKYIFINFYQHCFSRLKRNRRLKVDSDTVVLAKMVNLVILVNFLILTNLLILVSFVIFVILVILVYLMILLNLLRLVNLVLLMNLLILITIVIFVIQVMLGS